MQLGATLPRSSSYSTMLKTRHEWSDPHSSRQLAPGGGASIIRPLDVFVSVLHANL